MRSHDESMAINTYPEPYRSAKKDSLIDPSTCYNRECTSYCAWKVCETTGSWLKRTGDMNARNWIYRLPENGFKTVVSSPNGNKCIGVKQTGKYGHVVWSDGTLTITDYNWNSDGNFKEHTVTASAYRWYVISATSQGFLPNRGYWKKGDRDARIGEMDSWFRATFPMYAPPSILGNYFGNTTEKTVREFQRRTGLVPDGMVGKLTYAKMKQYGFKG